MATPQAFVDTTELDELRQPVRARLWEMCRKQPLGVAGAFIVLLMIFAATFANVAFALRPRAERVEAHAGRT